MNDNRNVMLEVAQLIARTPVTKHLRTSDIRKAGRSYGESGTQRFREHAIRFRKLTGRLSHEYLRDGYYRITGDFRRYCQKYVREHQN